MAQPNGVYPRLNGGMMQTGQYQNLIVSLVGKVTAVNTLTAADGSTVTVDVDQLGDTRLMMVNEDRVIEIIGMVANPTTLTAFVCRDLGNDMDMQLYNTMIQMIQQPKYQPYFGKQMTGVGMASN
ncbi:MAG: hypothetical protein SGILL_004120 [Bacillariaceae sp.]